MKKLLSTVLTASMIVGLMTGCNAESATAETAVVTASKKEAPQETTIKEETSEPKTQQFVLKHTNDLVNAGYADIVLDEVPDRIVSMSSYPTLALYEMGYNDEMIAIPTTSTIHYPDDLKAEFLPGIMNSTFDIEYIISLEPDIVIFPATSPNHIKTLTDSGIPVYAIGMSDMEKKMNTYEYMKHQTELLVEAFGIDDEAKAAGESISQRFATLEKRIEEVKPQFEGKTYISITIADPTNYYALSGAMANMMGMLGWTDAMVDPSKEQSDAGHGMTGTVNLETLAVTESDKILYVASRTSTLEEASKQVKAAQETNPTVWNAIPAVSRGDEIALTSSYMVTSGIQIIETFNNLIDILLETN
ncbi:hypothetical protein AN639_04710 [Candidatus Epulonipiscium fishelsonii]|uniref:Uncharacterized protein n=1 Tax=Candidatus Epulonipiscium fishelsonii TaxID=77094 RepID=A0ACC8XCZ3_9FIRM|nr:hypothetical protein AN639_04710 [Epulopiscium sp. SCG-B05WGA-EpuloA1]ONI40780.1 hypothetical protein AN396_05015 [Epulopiscium sp. SCG-B11WGA-EpuloA1]